MAVFEVEIDGQIYEVDDSSLGQYVNPETGELELDVFANDMATHLKGEGTTPGSQTGLNEEQKSAIKSADEVLAELNQQFPRKSPMWAGGVRSFASGAIPFADEIEAGARSAFTDTPYEEYLNRANESKQRFAADHPIGSLLASGAGTIASFAVPGSPLAKGAQWASKGASFGSKLGRAALLEGGTGALWGFGEGEGGFGNRLSNAGTGLALGLIGGTAAPVAAAGLGGLNRSVRNLWHGMGAPLTPQEVDTFVLKNLLTEEGTKTADILRRSVWQGAEDIGDPLTSLNETWKQAHRKTANLANPRNYKTPSKGGTTVDQLYKVTPESYTKAKADFADFVEANPAVQTDVGWRAGADFQKRNPSAAKIIAESKELPTIDPDSFEWWQKAEQILSQKLPKKIPDPSKLSGETKKIYDAVTDISKTREQLFPGTQKINEQYLAGRVNKSNQPSITQEKLRYLDSKTNPYRVDGGWFTAISNALYRPFDRGIARRTIRNGVVPPKQASSETYQRAQQAFDALGKSLLGW